MCELLLSTRRGADGVPGASRPALRLRAETYVHHLATPDHQREDPLLQGRGLGNVPEAEEKKKTVPYTHSDLRLGVASRPD